MAHERVDRQFLPAALATIHTVNNNLKATFVEFTFHNTAEGFQNVYVRFVPNGAASAASHQVIGTKARQTLRPGETRIYSFQPFLNPGDFIQWRASSANAVVGGCAILEE